VNTSVANNTSTLNTTPPNNNTANSDELRRLRFENLILQSKVETLEAENKSLKEVRVKVRLRVIMIMKVIVIIKVPNCEHENNCENERNRVKDCSKKSYECPNNLQLC
jgi:hypothetical protein